MPLYELICIVRPGLAKDTARYLRNAKQTIEGLGGVVRTAEVLGDRIMAKTIKGKDYNPYIVGRYLQVFVDAHPLVLGYIQKQMKDEKELLRMSFHRIPDFYREAQDIITADEKFDAETNKFVFEEEEKTKLEKMIEKIKGNVIIH